MNTNKTILNSRKVGGDYFFFYYNRKSNYKLDHFINQFNFNDYHCFKSTRFQILVNYQEFLEFKYASYTFIKKDLYNLNHILMWLDYLKSIGGIQFLNKPLPPFNPNKIIIK